MPRLLTMLVVLGTLALVGQSSILFPEAACATGDDWPEWRGPSGQGHSNASNLPERFSDSVNVKWQAPIPGKGWSTPVVSENQIWLTTAIETAPTEEDLATLAQRQNARTLMVSGSVVLRAVCLDRASGEVLHDIELFVEHDPQQIHTLNSYASPTPILNDRHLYCHFGAHGTCCVDTESGNILWRNREIRIEHENGPGSTPILWRNRLIFHGDGTDDQFIVALDTASGDEAWRTSRSGEMPDNPQFKKSYGTPLLIETDQGDVVISPAADWVYGYDPASGTELWKVSYEEQGFSVVPRPVFGNGMFYMSTSFMRPEVLAFKMNPGDASPSIEWRQARQAPRMPSPLLIEGELYTISDNGIASCLDAQSGEIVWAERLGGNFSSSPLFADGKIFAGNRNGDVFVFRPGRDFEMISVNSLDSGVMASPVAVDEELFIRTEDSLYCLQR